MIAFGVYSAVGIQLVLSIVAGAYLGQWLDRRFETDPWLMMVGIFLGAAAGFYNLFHLVNWKNRRKN